MREEMLFERMAGILDLPTGEVTADYKFGEEAWDSLALMAVAACLDDLYDVVVPMKSLAACEDMRQLMALVEAEKKDGGE